MSNSISLEYLDQALSSEIKLTETALCAQNTAGSTIGVITGGEPVPLATRPYSNGFIANGANTTFTVSNSGTYLITYSIYTTAGLLISSSVYRNGAAIANLTRSPGVAGNNFSMAAIVPLTADDVLQLTLFGLLGSATLQGGVGAYMNIIRIA